MILVSIVIPTKDRLEQLKRLIDSIKDSDYKNYEIIIVNDGGKKIEKDCFDIENIKIINNKTNIGLAYSRSLGAKQSKGKYVLFIDDDNVIEKNMIGKLVEVLEKYENVIGVGPLTYYLQDKNRVWFLGGGINLTTSKAYFFKEIIKGRLFTKKMFITDNLHNCFMVRKKDGDKVGWFDEYIFMSGTEFDLLKKVNIKCYNGKGLLITCLDAISYHDVPILSTKTLRSYGFANEKRVYYFQRNRGLLIGRYGKWWQKVIFGFIWYPFFLLVYSGLFIVHKRFDYLKWHVKGTIDGYKELFG